VEGTIDVFGTRNPTKSTFFIIFPVTCPLLPSILGGRATYDTALPLVATDDGIAAGEPTERYNCRFIRD